MGRDLRSRRNRFACWARAAAVLALLIVITACTPQSTISSRSTEQPGQPPSPEATTLRPPTYRPGLIVSAFALSDSKNGPVEVENAGLSGRYVHNGYEVLVKLPGGYLFDSKDLPRDTGFAESLRVEIDMTFLSSPAQKPNVGLTCRLFSLKDELGMYQFNVTPSGIAFLGRWHADTGTYTNIATTTESNPAIRESLPNHIQADCLQDRGSVVLVLTVNGTDLLRERDDSPGPITRFGDPGFSILSAPEPGFAAIFSNLRVTEMLRGP